MRVTLPYSYVLEFRRPRRKTADRQYFTDHVTFELPEVSSSETGLVAEWVNHTDTGGAIPMTARRWGDGLYVPTDEITDVELMASDIPSLPNERVFSSRPFEALYGMRPGQTRYDTIHDTLFCVPHWSTVPRNIEVIQSTRDEERQHAEACFGNLLSIDGKIWKRVPSLVLALTHCEPDGYLYASVQAGRSGLAHRYLSYGSLPFWHTLKLPMGQEDLLEEFRHPTFVPDHAVKYSDVSIHDPSALEFDALRDFVARGAEEIVSRLAADIGNTTPDMVEGWLNMRQFVEAANADRTCEISEGDLEFFQLAVERLYLTSRRQEGLLDVQLAEGVRVNVATAESGFSFVPSALQKLRDSVKPAPGSPYLSGPSR